MTPKTHMNGTKLFSPIGIFFILVLSGIIRLSCQSAEEKQAWNIVYILSDDVGWNQMGYHGSNFYETTNIDQIAGEGIHFTNAYAADPVCSPTRGSIMTGKYPARLHLTDYIPGSPYPYARLTTPQQAPCLPLEEVIIAEKLKERGYVTGHFGKWHLSPDKNYKPGRPFDPGSQGFDVVFTSVKPKPDADPEKDAHHTVEIVERSIKFIEEFKSQPFFCYVAFHTVHRPIMEHADLIAKYEKKPNSDDPVNNPIMGAMIERMDVGIGQIIDKLEELGLTDKTIVIFYSDNGGLESLQDQAPLRGGKATVFEGGIKVPMAIKWPGVITPGIISETLVSSQDFFPTIMEMTGTPYDKDKLDGVSLMPLLKQEGDLIRNTLYWHYPHYHHQGYKPGGAIREGDYKLIEWFEPTLTDGIGQVNLYNLKEDIGESTDLSNDMPELRDRLRQKLHDWRKAVNAQEMKVNPNYDPDRADYRFLNSKTDN
jgi:arylsulfatase A-like enzyme